MLRGMFNVCIDLACINRLLQRCLVRECIVFCQEVTRRLLAIATVGQQLGARVAQAQKRLSLKLLPEF
jgi:hypothetical protein